MDNAQKAIMIGVGLFITIIIISVVLLITNLGTGMVDDARENLGNMSAALQAQIKTQYDQKTLKGADIVNAINQYGSDVNFVIVVKSDEKDASGDYPYEYISGQTLLATDKLTTAAPYELNGTEVLTKNTDLVKTIDLSNTYKTYVLYDGTEAIGIVALPMYVH